MPVVESELCATITLIVSHDQKVSNRISNIKKAQKIYEKRSIPSNEHIIAYCEGTLPLLRMTSGFVLFTNRAFYPSDLGDLTRVPYTELCQYIVTQKDDKDSVYLRNADEAHMVYMPTLFAKNVAGCEIRALLEEIQAYHCIHDEASRVQYQTTIERVYARAKEERCAGELSENTKAVLLAMAGKESEDSVRLLAECQFRLCDAGKYRSYIQKLPISPALQEKYLEIPAEFYEALQNDLANPTCAFSDAYLNGIIDTIEKQKDLSDFEERYYQFVKAYALSRIDPITARSEYQVLKEAHPDQNLNVLEDMIYLYGSKQMRKTYKQLSLGNDVSSACFQYIDGLNLTPLHYALIFGREELVSNWVENKKCTFAHELEQTSQIGIWSYGVLAEILQSNHTKEILLHTVPEFVEIQAEIKKNERTLGLCEVKQQALKTATDKAAQVLKPIWRDDPELKLRTEEEKKRIKSFMADYEHFMADLNAVKAKIETLERRNEQLETSLPHDCNRMLRDIQRYLSALPAKSSPIDNFIMQIYKQQIDVDGILEQTETETVLRMYFDQGCSLLLPDTIHLDLPYRIVRITEHGIEDCGDGIASDSVPEEAPVAEENEPECPKQPFPDSWFSEKAHIDAAVLKSEYRAYAKKYHPDVCSNEEAHEAFLAIKIEYDSILNKIT